MLIRLSTCFSVSVLIVATFGCYDPTANKVDAGAGAAKQEQAVKATSSDLEFLLDAENTDVKWTGSNSVGQTPHGYFFELTGKAVVDGNRIKHLEIEFEMEGVKASNEALTEKLKKKGFFEVDKYPKSRFVTTSVDGEIPASSPDGTTQLLEGNFQLRDTTKSISFPIIAAVKEGSLKLTSQFKLNRRDYGVVYSDQTGDALIRDDVLINIEINVGE